MPRTTLKVEELEKIGFITMGLIAALIFGNTVFIMARKLHHILKTLREKAAASAKTTPVNPFSKP